MKLAFCRNLNGVDVQVVVEPNGHVANVPGKGDCEPRPLAMSFQVVVRYRHILLLHHTQTCFHDWLKKTYAARSAYCTFMAAELRC